MAEQTYTWISLTSTLALGVLDETISVHAIKAATMNATVVKNPKTFWMRTSEECMIALVALRARLSQLECILYANNYSDCVRRDHSSPGCCDKNLIGSSLRSYIARD